MLCAPLMYKPLTEVHLLLCLLKGETRGYCDMLHRNITLSRNGAASGLESGTAFQRQVRVLVKQQLYLVLGTVLEKKISAFLLMMLGINPTLWLLS